MSVYVRERECVCVCVCVCVYVSVCVYVCEPDCLSVSHQSYLNLPTIQSACKVLYTHTTYDKLYIRVYDYTACGLCCHGDERREWVGVKYISKEVGSHLNDCVSLFPSLAGPLV